MNVRSETITKLEKAILHLVDIGDDKILFYHHHEHKDIVSVAITICNQHRIPYQLFSRCIKINGGVLEFVRT